MIPSEKESANFTSAKDSGDSQLSLGSPFLAYFSSITSLGSDACNDLVHKAAANLARTLYVVIRFP